jgi:hypothetical protein
MDTVRNRVKDLEWFISASHPDTTFEKVLDPDPAPHPTHRQKQVNNLTFFFIVSRAFLRIIKKLDEESYGGGSFDFYFLKIVLSLILFVFLNSSYPLPTSLISGRICNQARYLRTRESLLPAGNRSSWMIRNEIKSSFTLNRFAPVDDPSGEVSL